MNEFDQWERERERERERENIVCSDCLFTYLLKLIEEVVCLFVF